MELNKILTFCCVALFIAGCAKGEPFCSSDIQELRTVSTKYKAMFSRNVRTRDSSDCYVLYNIRMGPGDAERRTLCFKVVRELESMRDEYKGFAEEIRNLEIGPVCENMEEVKSEFDKLTFEMLMVNSYMATEVLRSSTKLQDAFRPKRR